MKELLTKVTAFQEEAVSLLSQEMPDSEAIAKMVDTGCSLDIDLPELPRLKHKLQQVCFDVFFFLLFFNEIGNPFHVIFLFSSSQHITFSG